MADQLTELSDDCENSLRIYLDENPLSDLDQLLSDIEPFNLESLEQADLSLETFDIETFGITQTGD